MSNPIKVFISHRNSPFSNLVTNNLTGELKNRGFEIFWDYQSLRAGDAWAEAIFDAICESDVLIVLLENQVMQSHWVQREVDIARGAQIKILPIVIEQNGVNEVSERLGIEPLQYITFDSKSPNYESIVAEVRRLSVETRHQQKSFIEELERKWDPRQGDSRRASNKKELVTFLPRISDAHTKIHLATGDMLSFSNIDVIVNSENNHLQMARIYETKTVSSKLRYRGSLINDADGKIIEDTLQLELDAYVTYKSKGRPIRWTMAIPTTAGHPESQLRQETAARYIFHAITINVEHNAKKVSPIDSDDGICNCVTNCLKLVNTVNKAKGVISPEGWVLTDALGRNRKLHEEQTHVMEDYKPITSIIFPLLAAGHGNRPTGEVVPPMLTGIHDFLAANPTTSLTDIYICAYFEYDVNTVKAAMKDRFDEA